MSCKLELLLPYIDPAQLPWDYQELVKIVGLEKTLEIAARIGKTYVYLEGLDTILMPAKREYVETLKRSPDPMNVRQIARDLDLSHVAVYEMLRPKRSEDKAGWQQDELL